MPCIGANNAKHPLNALTGGTYIKTACVVTIDYGYADAFAYCVANSMKLFIIDSTAVQDALIAMLQISYAYSNGAYRVDGLRDETGDNNWYTYGNGKTPAFSGMKWYDTSDTYTGYSSLMVTSMAYPMSKVISTYLVDGITLTTPFSFICEYV